MVQQNGKGGFVTTASAAAAGGIAGTWYHMLNIRLIDLHPTFKELDLIANHQIKIKLRVNQGYVDVTTGASNAMSLTCTTLTSGTTVPIMIASAAAGNPMNGVPNATSGSLRVAFGPLQNSLTTLSTSGQIFPFTTSRLCIPVYDIANPLQIVQKPIKKVNYLGCYAQYFTQKAGLGVSTTQQNVAFGFQLSASLKNMKYVALIPYAETSSGHFTNASANLTQQFASPSDSAPWTCQPGASVRNFQIGNENIFNKTIDYDYESFFDELSKIAAINGNLSHEISSSLVDFTKGPNVQRILLADCSRVTNLEALQSVSVSGVNNCSQASSYLILIIYQRSLSTGEDSIDTCDQEVINNRNESEAQPIIYSQSTTNRYASKASRRLQRFLADVLSRPALIMLLYVGAASISSDPRIETRRRSEPTPSHGETDQRK